MTEDGSYTPSMDKPDQALDFVQDAVSSCGYSLGTEIHIVLNCAASEFYDQVSSSIGRVCRVQKRRVHTQFTRRFFRVVSNVVQITVKLEKIVLNQFIDHTRNILLALRQEPNGVKLIHNMLQSADSIPSYNAADV